MNTRTRGPKRRASVRSEAERDRLVEQHFDLVRRVAGALFARSSYLRRAFRGRIDDAESAGYTGLLRAAELWDPAMTASFAVYASYAISNRIRDWLRHHHDLIHVPRLARRNPANQHLSRIGPLVEDKLYVEERDDCRYPPEYREALDEALVKLSDRERRLIRHYYELGLPLGQLAAVEKRTKSTMSLRHTAAIRHLRAFIRESHPELLIR
jgi:RNA polymerase sigma factor (sigma-70 family)